MSLIKQIISQLEQGCPFALATVVRASGSTPQKAGAKAIFEQGGVIHGTLGGGCLEAESRRRALSALDDQQPQVFDLNLDDDYGWDDGLICGGKVRVLVDPQPHKHRAALRAANEALDLGQSGALLTRIENGAVTVSWLGESNVGNETALPGGAAIQKCMDTGFPAWFSDAGLEVYVEPVGPAPALLIAGGGHVGQAVARLGAWLGFEITVIDDRAAFVDASRYPEGVRTICGDIPREVGAFPITSKTYIVIVTRGHRHDGVVLKECIHSPAAYIGMIGSKRKAHIIRKGLVDEGIATEADFARVHSPIGLDIGALSVEEIAVSIAAELVAARRKHAGASLPLSVYAAK